MARGAPIGHRIRQRRAEAGLSQAALARQAGISPAYLNLIEHNKRAIGGALVGRLAAALALRPSDLAGREEAQLLDALTEIAADPMFAAAPIDAAELRSVLGVGPSVAAALRAVYRAWRAAATEVETLSERVSHDPVLAESSHAILTRITAIRALAEILRDHRALAPARRRRFTESIVAESERLSDAATALFGFLERSAAPSGAASPDEEVEDLLAESGNHFPTLEAAAERIARRAAPIAGPTASARFAAARALARDRACDEIAAVLAGARLTTGAARDRAGAALERYGAAALLMPYAPFREAARALRYDVDLLAAQFGASWEQVCHRLTTLRRPGAEGVPFLFLRTDIAGNVSKRLSASGLNLPRYGGICPRWAVHHAFLAPGRVVTQRVMLEDGSRYLFIAHAGARGAGHGAPESHHSVMIGCDAAYAPELVYGDALGAQVPAGLTCRRCARPDCAQRAHPQSVTDAQPAR